jgi:hypothetical protein
VALCLENEAKLDERQQHTSRNRAVDACAICDFSEAERRVRSIECLNDGESTCERTNEGLTAARRILHLLSPNQKLDGAKT